ncbi:MAG: tetratricopeptide repeat protein [Xanthobacteraceae bacterium]|nr:tetratricopeptide repeat protein [Xanthobacteraceae bacterium]
MPAARGRDPRTLCNMGVRARKDGDRKQALAYFELAAAADPRHLRARLEAGRELAALARFDEAASMFRRVLADDPQHVQAVLELAMLLRDRSRFEEAEELLQRAVALAPDDVRVRLNLARLLRRRGDHDGARAHLDHAAAADPSHDGVQIEIAADLRDRQAFDEARRILEAILERDPDSIKAWKQIGTLERRRGDHKAARDAFKRLVELDPGDLQSLALLAVEERALGNPAASESLLKRALQANPEQPAALMQLAEHCWLAEDDQASLEWSFRAIRSDPGNPMPYLSASRAAAELGRTDLAFALLDQATDMFGDDPGIVTRRAQILRMAGRLTEARAAMAEAPDRIEAFGAWSARVQFYLSLGDCPSAEQALRDAPAISNPDRARVHALRGHLAKDRWDFEQALDEYHRSIEIDPANGNTRRDVARLYLLTLDLDRAREALRASIAFGASRILLRGESINVSQSILGQLLNEYALDRDNVHNLRALRALPAAERMAQAQAIVRQAPDSTAAAIYLLVAMRQAGRLRGAGAGNSAASANARIPRRIIQYWDAPSPPDSVAEMMQSWRDMHPGWDYQRFDDKLARTFLAANHPPEVLRAYARASHPAQKADLFRLAFLSLEGGFYADADDRAVAHLETVVPDDIAFAGYQEDLGSVGNNVLGAGPGDPVIEQALRMAVLAVNRGDRDFLWLSTGPGLMSRVFAQFLADPASADQVLSRTLLLERGDLTRAVAIHCRLHYKKSALHWHHGAFAKAGGPAVRPAASRPAPARL